MMRGDLITVVTSGDYGKPRPALIVQGDAFAAHSSVTVLPLTSELHDLPLLRLTIDPSPDTGLRVRSQIMIDKVITIPRTRAGSRIGRVDADIMFAVGQAMQNFLGLV
jgi:mRNA interferase MazF